MASQPFADYYSEQPKHPRLLYSQHAPQNQFVMPALRANDAPRVAFETTALTKARNGEPVSDIQKVERSDIAGFGPVTNLQKVCGTCHTNFGSEQGSVVGALTIRAPVTDAKRDR